jgi:hypothetical protein
MVLLTKSRFKLALSCPTKLYYNQREEYDNVQKEDKFLQALAEGGYQVGELAKCYFPGGFEITDKGYEVPLKKTNELLLNDCVTIYEAAIRWENCFVRVDILRKNGNNIELIEVKAKSFSGSADEFLSKKGTPSSGWNGYLQDVAFQKYVAQKAFPQWNITAFLMLADKSKKSTVNGLNQKFFLKKEGNQLNVEKNGDVSLESIGNPILSCINVDHIATDFIADVFLKQGEELPYEEKIHIWANSLQNQEKLNTQTGVHCFGCQFQTTNPEKKSGFNECWKHHHGFSDEQLSLPLVKEIWNYRGKSKLLEEGVIFIDNVQQESIGKIEPKEDGTLSTAERQWMQIEKIKNNDDTIYFDSDLMKSKMEEFIYPFHFIDFETSMSAIPFYTNQRPYETIAFQFSHHVMYENGDIEHKTEYIKLERGEFPNFEFVRSLKEALGNDSGSIFRFAAHENTILNQIGRQLVEASEIDVPDKLSLIDFINDITEDKKENRKGFRSMIDMCKLVKDYYYDPRTNGSNSIKAVLPSVLSRSEYLQDKYSKPIYGKSSIIKSKNFDTGWIWIQRDIDNKVIDPYKLLPKLFNDVDEDMANSFITEDSINSGGAALTAFAKIQFMQMTDTERNLVIQGLLKYCELDTLAMVMIFEHWKELINSKN